MQSAQTVLLYCSLPDEVDTRLVLSRLVRMGKHVLLPAVVDGMQMELRSYGSEAALREGAYHIWEPVGERFLDYGRIDVAVVPGMAFDADGHRLGRGKGYYDRFLPLCSRAWRIGLCFDFQLLPHVPADGHDVCMDEVIAGGKLWPAK